MLILIQKEKKGAELTLSYNKRPYAKRKGNGN